MALTRSDAKSEMEQIITKICESMVSENSHFLENRLKSDILQTTPGFQFRFEKISRTLNQLLFEKKTKDSHSFEIEFIDHPNSFRLRDTTSGVNFDIIFTASDTELPLDPDSAPDFIFTDIAAISESM